MEHAPYPKIPASHSGSLMAPGGVWVATEKVHGAQVVVGTDGTAVRVGKRKSWLQPHDSFFGWQLLRTQLEVAALAVFSSIMTTSHARPSMVRLYGELFGGHYPHESVSAVSGAAPVQTGIWYAPEVGFMLFDILVERGDGAMFLAHNQVEVLAVAAGLPFVPVLGRGPRATLELLPVRFVTRVPQQLGLPEIVGNVAEGFVLKPDVAASPATRVVIKHKIPEFDDARFDESAPWDPAARLNLSAIQDIATRLVNTARVASARSKVGTDHEAVMDELLLDVLVDIELTFPSAFSALSPAEEAVLRAHVLDLGRALL
jgi:Rnl2 family RNA ligase